MSSSSETPDPDPRDTRQERDATYWAEEFKRLGMLWPQALTLAYDRLVDRHKVRETLERGCDPELCFRIFASWDDRER